MNARRIVGALGLVAAALLWATFLGAIASEARAGIGLGALLYSIVLSPLSVQFALAVFLTVVGVRFAFYAAPLVELPAPRAEPRAGVAPVAVPPEESEREEGALIACLRCGSLDVGPATISDGLFIGGETLVSVCHRCAWRGQPVEFDSATSYREFVRSLQKT